MFRLLQESLHEGDFALGDKVVSAARVNEPQFYQPTFGIIKVPFVNGGICPRSASLSSLLDLDPKLLS